MSWFKKSSTANIANQAKSTESSSQAIGPSSETAEDIPAVDMSKSISSLDEAHIEILDPEVFFQDPEQVLAYKEEETFLQIMSEWEIIENPAQLITANGNYFSADFEEELLQMKTQDASAGYTSAMLDSGSLSDDNNFADIYYYQQLQQQQQQYQQQEQQQQAEHEKWLQRRCKRKFYEIFFSDNIQTGIALPKRVRRKHVKHKKAKYKGNLKIDESLTESETEKEQIEEEEKSEKLKLLENTKILSRSSSYTCPNQVIKDCGIDRELLKTEALAGSIMGAIGKCPAKDSSPVTSVNDLTKRTVDICHPQRLSGCDHYDIKKFFRLDDNGNILLNINHIVEYRGYGFAIAHNKSLYRRHLKQCQSITETYSCGHKGLWYYLKRLLKLLCVLLTGHPRNNTNNCASGRGDFVSAYTLKLAQDHSSTFSRNIENFISCTMESREAAPQVVMRNMRQFMNGMKNYLVKHGEGEFHKNVEEARAQLKADEFLNLDAILETVMHQLVVLPLREHLYCMFVEYYTRSDDIQLLAENIKYACGRSPADFGIRPTVTPPPSTVLQMISNLLLRLQEAELPLDKLELFMRIITTIFDNTGRPRGQQLGADDFLPILVYVVAKCGFFCAEIEAEFMWGLLQPALLNGEQGYYLTALCSAVHVLKSFMASDNENGTGSLDWRSSSLPACSSVLRVIIPDECNGSLQTRTLPVRPHTTTREVCRIIAHKARITNPQDYALFKLVDGEETLLNDIECPQDIRLAAKGKHCMLAYKRTDAKIAWPTATQPICNE